MRPAAWRRSVRRTRRFPGASTLANARFHRTTIGSVELIAPLDSVASRPLEEKFVKKALQAEVRSLLPSPHLCTDTIDMPSLVQA